MEERNDRAWAFCGGLLVGLGPTVAMLPSWGALYETPAFTGLAMSVVGGVVGAVFVRSRAWSRVKDALAREAPEK